MEAGDAIVVRAAPARAAARVPCACAGARGRSPCRPPPTAAEPLPARAAIAPRSRRWQVACEFEIPEGLQSISKSGVLRNVLDPQVRTGPPPRMPACLPAPCGREHTLRPRSPTPRPSPGEGECIGRGARRPGICLRLGRAGAAKVRGRGPACAPHHSAMSRTPRPSARTGALLRPPLAGPECALVRRDAGGAAAAAKRRAPYSRNAGLAWARRRRARREA